MKSQNPAGTALMRQREEEAKAAGKQYRVNQQWVPLSRVPKAVVDAIIVAEDGTFYTHGGVDWFEVRESLEKDIEERRAARGASTITQQVAKNLFLSTSKDPVRKLKELLITYLLEKELGKDRILEIYLNIVEWGPGIYGIEAASEAYFGVHAGDLTLDQGARLAAVIPSPLRHRPDDDGRYVLRRRGIVLARMQARSMIGTPAGDPGVTSVDSGGTHAGTSPVTPVAADSAAGGDTTEIEEGEPNGL